MKVVLLAGGFGSRISEESQFKPKQIGGIPILWHIMQEYAYCGHTPSLLFVPVTSRSISRNVLRIIFFYNSERNIRLLG